MATPVKILVADDERELVEAISDRLKAASYAVLAAYDGQQTLEIALRERPDLILLDVLMPVLDGYSCLRKINAALGRSTIPVIVLTSREYMKDLFTLEGIQDYLVKPFDPDALLERIAAVLAKKRNPPAADSDRPH